MGRECIWAVDEPSHRCGRGSLCEGGIGVLPGLNPAQQGLQWTWASRVAITRATCKGRGSVCRLIRLSQIQSRAKMDFLMRLLAALKTQIEFKRDSRRHQKTIWRQKAQWARTPSMGNAPASWSFLGGGARRAVKSHSPPHRYPQSTRSV